MNTFLSKSIYIGHIRSVGIYFDIMLIPALIASYITGGMEFALMSLPVFAVHELAHIFAAYLFDCKIASFTLMPIGGMLAASNINSAKTAQICALYAFAPITNIMFFTLFYALGMKDSSLIFMQIAYLNGFLAAFSLLPVYPLDGGNILKTMLRTKLDEHRVLCVLLTINIIISIILIFAAIYSFIYYSQILWQLLIIAFLFVYSTVKEKNASVSSSISNIMNKDIRLCNEGVLSANKLYILHNATIACGIKALRHNSFNTFAVIDEKFNVFGELSEKQLLDAAIKYGVNSTVSAVLKMN